MRRAAAGAFLALAIAPPAASAGEITLAFGDAPGGASGGFRIERREAGAQRFEALALVGPGVPDFVDRGLPVGVTYCYRVRALAAEGEAAWSPEVCTVAEEAPALAEGPGGAEGPAVSAEGATPELAAEGATAEPAAEGAEEPAAAEPGAAVAAKPAAQEAAPGEPAAAQPVAEEPAGQEAATPASVEPDAGAPAPKPRRIRTSGGWLQVLD